MVALATLSVLVVCEVSAKEEEAQGVSRGADKWFEPMTKVATAKIGRTPAGVNKSGLLFGGILSILTPIHELCAMAISVNRTPGAFTVAYLQCKTLNDIEVADGNY